MRKQNISRDSVVVCYILEVMRSLPCCFVVWFIVDVHRWSAEAAIAFLTLSVCLFVGRVALECVPMQANVYVICGHRKVSGGCDQSCV